MPSPGPLPQTSEDGVINAVKGAFTHHVPVIIDPTPYFGVEPTDQIGGRHAQRGFDCLPDAAKEGLNILLGRLDEQFPVRVLATFCPRKSKPFPTCVMTVFAGESSRPRFCRNCSTRGLISPSSSSLLLPVMMKSSA